MTPPCYNRAPAAAGRWECVSRHPRTGKPHYRWRPRWFEDCCTQHDGAGIGPNGESYAAAQGYDCAGCRWEPARIRQAREFEARMRGIPVDNPVDMPKVIHISTPSALAPKYAELAAMAAVNFSARLHGLPDDRL